MSVALSFQQSARSLVRHFGGGMEVTLRRPVSLADPLEGDAVLDLQLVGAHAMGETSLVADAMAVQGRVPSGVELTIAGVTGTYTVTADATASGNAVTLPITPGLEGAAADDADVTLAAYAEFTFQAVRGQFVSRDEMAGRAGDFNRGEMRSERFLVATNGSTLIEDDDLLILPNGRVISVGVVRTHQYDGTTPVAFVVEGRQ